jgi:GntR family transcriptional repressor for pyruvate dehydrogenase complex
MTFEPILQTSLVDRVVEQIRGVINQGHYSAGDRLPTEFELSEKLQVSRSVLREAVGRLETLGVLEVRRGRGMFVADRASLAGCVNLLRSAMTISPKDLRQFAELRRGMEMQAARLAAQRATAVQLGELEALCEQMDADGVSYPESVRADCAFHRKLIEVAGNELLQNLMEVVHDFLFAGMVQTTPRPRNLTRSRQYHRPILDAIRAKDPDAAEAAMKVHMDSVERAVRDIEAKQKQN